MTYCHEVCHHVEVKMTHIPRKGQTTSGYGRAIPTPYCVRFEGEGDNRWRRVYVTIFSNCGTSWIKHNGEKLYFRHCDFIGVDSIPMGEIMKVIL